MAGALGNCYDRLVLGHVRDFVHFHVDPIGFDCAIFNFADNMLVAGAITLMLLALRARARLRPEPSDRPDVVLPSRGRVRPLVPDRDRGLRRLTRRNRARTRTGAAGRGSPRPRGSACTRSRCR